MIPKDTIIVTDSACDLSDDLLLKYNIKIIPLRIITSTKEYRDRIDINQEEVYAILESEIPSTSLPLPDDVNSMYDELINSGYKNVLHISLSSGLSGTYNMIKLVLEEYSDKMNIEIVDSKTLSAGLGLLVLKAAEAIDQGKTIYEAAELVRNLRKNQLGVFVVKTLEYLRKGGRIGLVEGVIGSLLQIKPIIMVNSDGIYETLAKARGFIKAKSLMIEKLQERYSNELVDISIVHGLAYDDAQNLSGDVKLALNVNSVSIVPVSPVLGIHTGAGLLGIIVLPVI